MSRDISVVEAAARAGVGRSTIYEHLARGVLRARKLGRRTVILEVDLREWLTSLPAMNQAALANGPPSQVLGR